MLATKCAAVSHKEVVTKASALVLSKVSGSGNERIENSACSLPYAFRYTDTYAIK